MRIKDLIEKLEPLAAIADRYDRGELDEHRPEWGYKDPKSIVLFSGRGGVELLTLQHVLDAREMRAVLMEGRLR